MSGVEDSDVDAGRLVPREEWGALEPKDEMRPLTHPVKYIWYIYETYGRSCSTYNECIKSMRELQRKYHKHTNLADIPFNFLIGGDGRIYEGRGWDFSAPESKEWTYTNGKRIEIGYLGKTQGDGVVDKMEMACGSIVMMGKEKKYIIDKAKHSEFERVGVPKLPYYDGEDEEEVYEIDEPPEDMGDENDGLNDDVEG